MPSSPIATVVDEIARQTQDRIDPPAWVTHSDRVQLLQALGQVPDPRRRRGVRHPFTAVLAVSVCAMLSGARSFAAIGEWTEARAGLGLVGRIPWMVTIWRVLVGVDPAALEAAIGAWVRARLGAVSARRRPRRRGRRSPAGSSRPPRARWPS